MGNVAVLQLGVELVQQLLLILVDISLLHIPLRCLLLALLKCMNNLLDLMLLSDVKINLVIKCLAIREPVRLEAVFLTIEGYEQVGELHQLLRLIRPNLDISLDVVAR